LKILIAIDDTDNLETPGTGHLASALSVLLEENGLGKGSPVTRHQLYVHPDIPYTSHNSSMCFEAQISGENFEHITAFCQDFLIRESAPGSDPGLCIVDIDALDKKDVLIEYGIRAKNTILNKKIAYDLASSLNIHLSEHGGTGDGIIGALAGTGLRLSGNDGRLKGHFPVGDINDTLTVKELLDRTKADMVKTEEGHILLDDDIVRIGKKVKAVYLDHRAVVLVFPVEDNGNDCKLWETCTKEQLKKY
jgi:tRNA(Ile2) C34 agmatinyltransferase TiaS